MKKILYTVSAIVLGLTASRAQAETGTKIAPYQVVHPQVDFVSTFGLTKGTELKFGVVVNPQVGQKITVSPNNELSGSYEGASTGNATLLGVGTLGSTANTIKVSTVSRGSVTITGNVATLNKAGTVRLQFPDEIPLSDGITCGTVKINPLLDGKDPNSTADDDVLSTAREVLYGGTLTLSTNETGKHCVGSGQVTLVFDDSAVFVPDDHSNDPVDNFSLIPPAQEPVVYEEEIYDHDGDSVDLSGLPGVYGQLVHQVGVDEQGDRLDGSTIKIDEFNIKWIYREDAGYTNIFNIWNDEHDLLAVSASMTVGDNSFLGLSYRDFALDLQMYRELQNVVIGLEDLDVATAHSTWKEHGSIFNGYTIFSNVNLRMYRPQDVFTNFADLEEAINIAPASLGLSLASVESMVSYPYGDTGSWMDLKQMILDNVDEMLGEHIDYSIFDIDWEEFEKGWEE